MTRSGFVAAALCAWAGVGIAGPPMPIAEFATVEELEAEAQARLAELEPLIEDAEFADKQARIGEVASMLVVAAQALADHAQDSPLQPFAPDLREAARQMATAETPADARQGFTAAQAAFARKSAKTAAPDADWAQLVAQRPIMEEMEVRMAKLQRALRRPKDPAVESGHARAVALATLTALADTHAVKDRDRLPEWERMSRQLAKQMQELSSHIQQKQTKAAQSVFKAARATCIECHREFKPE